MTKWWSSGPVLLLHEMEELVKYFYICYSTFWQCLWHDTAHDCILLCHIFSFSLIIFYFQVTSKTSPATNYQPQLEQTRSQPYRTAPLVTPSPKTVNEGGGFYQQFRGPQYNPTPRQQHRVNMTNNLWKEIIIYWNQFKFNRMRVKQALHA